MKAAENRRAHLPLSVGRRLADQAVADGVRATLRVKWFPAPCRFAVGLRSRQERLLSSLWPWQCARHSQSHRVVENRQRANA